MGKELLKNLSNKKYRVTQTRIDILDCLSDKHSHSIQEIIEHLKLKNKKISVGSIYNTIKMLVNEGIVDIYTDYINKSQVYELIDQNKYHIHIFDTDKEIEHKIKLQKEIEDELNKILDSKNLKACNIKIEILAKKKAK